MSIGSRGSKFLTRGTERELMGAEEGGVHTISTLLSNGCKCWR